MSIIDGKLVSNIIKENLKKEVNKLVRKPKLVVIQIGNNPASNIYIKNKEKTASELGIIFQHIKYEENTDENQIILDINNFNKDINIDGIIVQLPLPSNYNTNKIINTINYNKDVDGLTTTNIGKLFSSQECLTSCTPLGIIYLLDYYKIKLEGKDVVIVGRSNLVGKPLIELCLRKNATVSVCHSKTINLKEITLKADILISATGIRNLITTDMVKDECVIIDVGMNKDENNLLCGDVDYNNIVNKIKYITPVPGGVGPMTIAMLYSNLLKSYKNNL